jgi:adenine deaminase
VLALGGGMVVAAEGEVRAEVALPLGGISSGEPLDTLAAGILGVERALHELGCVREKPFLAVQILTFTAIPALRIRECGLWDVRKNRVVPLILEEEA